MMTTEERLDLIYDKIMEDDFLNRKGLGSEISFHIFDYEPQDEMLVRAHVQNLKARLASPSSKRKVIEFDFYSLLIKILEQEGLLNGMDAFEKEYGREYLLEALKGVASPDVYVKLIRERSQNYDVVFLTGIGKVWPVLRSHAVLNKLHEVLEKTPVIMFFPGRYDGVELRLFGKIEDNNYYRAFPLVPR